VADVTDLAKAVAAETERADRAEAELADLKGRISVVIAEAVESERERIRSALAGFFLMVDEDGDVILSAPCADTLGCLWSFRGAGERVTLGELMAGAWGHTGIAAGKAHAAFAAAAHDDGPENAGNPVAWSSAAAPGGWVCAVPAPGHLDGICGMPVESEPCREHGEAGQP
jgi:hypothetical protein